MNDIYYVNILNDKMIPWIQERGPLFGYKISIGVLSILRKDSSLNIQIIHSPEEAEAARRKWYGLDKKKPEILHDEVLVKDEVKMVEEPIVKREEPELTVDEQVELAQALEDAENSAEVAQEKMETKALTEALEVSIDAMDEIDLAIENSLKENPYVPADINVASAEKLEVKSFKKYTKKELEGMTKAQLKDILNVERGFASFTKRGAKGNAYAGKYHDTQKDLIKKVLDSQK